LAAAFQAAALRATPQRYAVMEYLLRKPVHATAEEIFEAVNRRDPRASRATVYNNLRALARAGLVFEVPTGGQAQRFEARRRQHHHLVCDRCGALEDVDWFELPLEMARQALGGRTVRGYEIVFRGACRNCEVQE
jgi:Fur family transcriptional regulator, peroxide stress response regulator